jgi:hypothetical protein
MLGQVGSAPDPLGNFSFLFGRQQGLGADITRLVGQTREALLVEPMHPVPQCLAVHPRRLGGIRARRALQNQSKRQHTSRSSNVLCTPRLAPKPRSVEIAPCDLDRRPHANLPESSAQRANHMNRSKGI